MSMSMNVAVSFQPLRVEDEDDEVDSAGRSRV